MDKQVEVEQLREQESGQIKKLLDRLNSEPARVLFPKSNLR